jgi:hypothetical protein
MEKRFGASLGHYYKGKSAEPVIESPEKETPKVEEKPATKPVFEQKGANKKNEK